jgi:hypothetical protein
MTNTTTDTRPADSAAATGSAPWGTIVARCDTCGRTYIAMRPEINTAPCMDVRCKKGVVRRIRKVPNDKHSEPAGENQSKP